MAVSRNDSGHSRQRYQHRPLDPASNAIRLLSLQRDQNSDDLIRCELMHTTLSEGPEYFALSYAWGNEQQERDILVDGRPYSVKQNLWSFLRQAQEALPGTVFWIDALCINQTSTKERGHQVQLMGSIYSNATKVIVWLGNEGSSVSYLFWLLGDTDCDLESLARSDAQQHLQTAYMLTQFPYWSRVWIIQELLLASHVDLMYNDDLLSWDCFWAGIHKLLYVSSHGLVQAAQVYDTAPSYPSYTRIASVGQIPGNLIHGITNSYAYRHYIQRDLQQQASGAKKTTDLSELLARYSASQSSLLRDRLVGLLCLMDRGHMFEDSYDGTMANLALRAFFYFNGNLDTLGRLRQALRVSHHNLYAELSTWQPSRISSLYDNPSSYRGEMIRFKASSEFVGLHDKLVCAKCNAHLSRKLSEVHPNATLFCLAGMGTRQHMVTVARCSATESLNGYVVFFDKAKPSESEISIETRFRSRSEGFMATNKRQSGDSWLYFSVDLFVYLAEYLRLPEVAYTSSVILEHTSAPVPCSKEHSDSDTQDDMNVDPIGLGSLCPVTVDLLVASDDGRTIAQWLEFRNTRQAYRDWSRLVAQPST